MCLTLKFLTWRDINGTLSGVQTSLACSSYFWMPGHPPLVTTLSLSTPGVSTSQTQQLRDSQVLQPEEALYLRKKKKRQDPYARFSALLYRRPPREDQKAILASMDTVDPDHATLLWGHQAKAMLPSQSHQSYETALSPWTPITSALQLSSCRQLNNLLFRLDAFFCIYFVSFFGTSEYISNTFQSFTPVQIPTQGKKNLKCA